MSKDGNTLTILGMLLTVVLSVGGTWVTNLVHTGINDTQIQSLIKSEEENKQVSAKVYTLVSEVSSIKSLQAAHTTDLKLLDTKVGAVEVDAARSAQAIENLVFATQQLTETNKQLVIAVTRMEK